MREERKAKLRGLSLFSGIGGLDLAFEWAGGQVAAMCEIQPYCQKILRKHWPNVPLFEDIKNLRGTDVGAVDVIYGGFPCQPFSVAGIQRGKDDSRYLWPEFSRLVGEIKPRWIVAENVPGILRIAADDVCSDLERQGYAVGIWDFEAASVGAKHRRERIFFVAHAGRSLRQGSFEQGALRDEGTRGNACQLERPSSPLIANPDIDSGGEAVTNAGSQQREEQRESVSVHETHIITGCSGRWEPEPGVGRVAHGSTHRVDRLRALGNAVVPQQIYPIFKAIIDIEEHEENMCAYRAKTMEEKAKAYETLFDEDSK